MTMKYIRDYYGVPAYRGRRVTVDDGSYPVKEGVILGSRDARLRVRLDQLIPTNPPLRTMLYHPMDLVYAEPTFSETGKDLGSEQPDQAKLLI